MSSEPATVRFCRAWVRTYTNGLPAEIGQRRVQEVESDLWEHRQAQPQGASLQILGRTLRGIHADVWWRYRTLLDQRGARQRSQPMQPPTTRSWWQPLTLVLGIAMATMGLLGLTLGETGNGSTAGRVLATVPPLLGGLLILAGLARQRSAMTAGSKMVIAGAVLAAADPIFIPLSALVIIGGLWTGNLLTTQRETPMRLDTARSSLTSGWHRWILAAVALATVGFGILILWENAGFVPDDCTEANPCWEDTAAWALWVISWLSAMITGGIGLALGLLHLRARHHTRPA